MNKYAMDNMPKYKVEMLTPSRTNKEENAVLNNKIASMWNDYQSAGSIGWELGLSRSAVKTRISRMRALGVNLRIGRETSRKDLGGRGKI